ncbi:WD40 repeat domain-containing protein [Acrocarpospora sp. B8E8]|uniref:WD40 repeat domain-containing protein n=1 Tax=Acrocarpospora sp. B8E8 TaxID=3153572 RepID=UPI00325DBDA2
MTDPRLRAWATAHARSAGRSGMHQSAGTAGAIELVDQETWLPRDTAIRALDWTFLEDGRPALACSDGASVYVLDGETGAIMSGWGTPTAVVRWWRRKKPDADYLMIANGDLALLFHPHGDSPERPEIRAAPLGTAIQTVAASSENSLFAAAGLSKEVVLFRLSRSHGLTRDSTLLGHRDWVVDLAWCRDLLASASADGTAKVWNGKTGRLLQTLDHRGWVSHVAFAELPDGTMLLATAAQDGKVRVWNPLTGELIHTLTGHMMEVSCVAWTVLPNGRALLASSGYDQIVRVWDGQTGARLTEGPPLGDILHAVIWGPTRDGRLRLVAGGAAGGLDVFTLNIDTSTADPRKAKAAKKVKPIESLTADLAPLPAEVDPNLRSWPLPGDLIATTLKNHTIRVVNRTGEWVMDLEGHEGLVLSVEGYLDAAGRLLVGSAAHDGAHVWKVSPRSGGIEAVPSRLPLMSGSAVVDGRQAWDVTDASRVAIASPSFGQMRSVAWGTRPDGEAIFAAVGTAGVVLSTLDRQSPWLMHEMGASSVSWANLPDGQLRLAVAVPRVGIEIRDWMNETIATLHHTPSPNAVAWAVLPDGDLRLASCGVDGEVNIWDADNDQVTHLSKHSKAANAVAWAALPDGRLLLASGGSDSVVLVHNGHTGKVLTQVTGYGGPVISLSWEIRPDGTIELWTRSSSGTDRFEVKITPPLPPVEPVKPAPPPPIERVLPGSIAAGLLKLGEGALWPALGLVADLISLTAPAIGSLHDPQLKAFEQHPGIVRLRALAWPEAARTAFAALLLAPLDHSPIFTPPTDGSDEIETALAYALTTDPIRAVATGFDLDQLSRAAYGITEQTITLLSLIGSQTAMDDPLLPLRMNHHVPHLPTLTERQLRLLADQSHTPDRRLRRSGGGTLRHTPGTAGIIRHGQPTHLLHTDLALPVDLFNLRSLQSQLLYRRHTTPQPPVPRPLTLILDTTPPTYGPAEQALRLAAHALTVASWAYGLEPILITLTDPDQPMPLAGIEQLLRMWTSRTLEAPHPALEKALDTASATARTTVALLHQHAPRRGHTASSSVPFVTTRHPAEPVGPRAGNAYHHELSPSPGGADLTALINALLLPGTARQASTRPRP